MSNDEYPSAITSTFYIYHSILDITYSYIGR